MSTLEPPEALRYVLAYDCPQCGAGKQEWCKSNGVWVHASRLSRAQEDKEYVAQAKARIEYKAPPSVDEQIFQHLRHIDQEKFPNYKLFKEKFMTALNNIDTALKDTDSLDKHAATLPDAVEVRDVPGRHRGDSRIEVYRTRVTRDPLTIGASIITAALITAVLVAFLAVFNLI